MDKRKVIFSAFALALAFGTGYYFYSRNQTPVFEKLPQKEVSIPTGWKQYMNSDYNFSLALPAENIRAEFLPPSDCKQVSPNKSVCTPAKSQLIQDFAGGGSERQHLVLSVSLLSMKSNVVLKEPAVAVGEIRSKSIQVGSTMGELKVSSQKHESLQTPISTITLISGKRLSADGKSTDQLVLSSSINPGVEELMEKIAATIQF